MIKVKIKQLLKEKGVPVSDMMYKCELAPGTAYKLARKDFMARNESIQAGVMNRLCNYFGCGVGDIFEHVQDGE